MITIFSHVFAITGMELRRVASQFVVKASGAVLHQLLDRLLEDGVLKDEERYSIRKEMLTRASKARRLIDCVIKKGHTASKKLIDHLQKIDPVLHHELGLTSAQPGMSVRPTPFVPTVEVFSKTERRRKKNKKENEQVYPVTQTSLRNRVALLITNVKFSENLIIRRGAEKDEENMEKLLSNLGYEVVKYTNLTGKAIDEALIEFTKHPKLKQTDSVFVVIMSHGQLGKILGVDWKEDKPDEFPIDNIFKHLGSKGCPALIDKPKVIIIEACRGERGGRVLVSDSPNTADYFSPPGDLEANKFQYLPLEKDFICLFSDMPEIIFFRQNRESFIENIVNVFRTKSYQKDISQLFEEVVHSFTHTGFLGRPQMPAIIRCTLIKHFYPLTGIRYVASC
uniref:Caspase a n=1 Tax=Poecilia mexicana TaxID=48701 RepID=A0A3B3WWI4_9TELE